MKRKGVLSLSASFALLTAFGIAIVLSGHSLTAQTPAPAAPAARGAAPAASSAAPNYRNVALWPKPLPNFWVFGSISGVTVGADDHIWVVHRGADTLEGNEKGMMANPPTSSVCCIAAPAVLEFDQNGTVLSSWGGPGLGFPWPQYTGGIAVDSKGNVWVAAFGL